jgi:hypothetical protein
MPRRQPLPDEDTLPVMVPINSKALVPVTPDRLRRFREHLVRTLVDARALKHAAPPRSQPPSGFAIEVAQVACGLCKGFCCRNGRDDAFLDHKTMARLRHDRPEMGTGALLKLYSDRIPALAYVVSCLFHGGRGCTLERSMRADICNTCYSGGLTSYLRSHEPPAETIVIAGKGDEMRTSAVLRPSSE